MNYDDFARERESLFAKNIKSFTQIRHGATTTAGARGLRLRSIAQ